MDKLAAIFDGFIGEIRGLKPLGKDDLRKLQSRDLRTEHNWAHRYAGSMGVNPKWGSGVGWTPAKLKKTHDDIVAEGKERGLPWCVNHTSPLIIPKKKPFIQHKIR